MSNGVTHRKITTVIGVATAPIALITPWWLVAEVGIGLTYWVNPDLDIHNHTGKLGEMLGFKQYKDLIPHRAGMNPKHWQGQKWPAIFAMSHIPWLGTLPRLVILILPVLLGMMILEVQDRQIWTYALTVLSWLWVGMGLSDLGHWAVDWITTKPRARRRPSRLRPRNGFARPKVDPTQDWNYKYREEQDGAGWGRK